MHRRFHYDRAFEHYLRANRVPYVAVDEAKRALAGERRQGRVAHGQALRDHARQAPVQDQAQAKPVPAVSVAGRFLPSGASNLSPSPQGQPERRPTAGSLTGVEVKPGPMLGGGGYSKGGVVSGGLKSFDFVVYAESGPNLLVDVKGRKHAGQTGRALQNWVTQDDVDSLTRWGELFGAGFDPAFVFLFWCEAQPPDALFHEVFVFAERWYAVLAVRLSDYRACMRPRSAKWGTVNLPAADFNRLHRPLMELL